MPSRILTSAKAGDTSAVITQATVFTIEAATSNSTAITAPGSLAGFVQLETAAATSSPQPSLANGVYVIHRGEGSLLEIQFYGTDSDGDTFGFQIEGWTVYKRPGSSGTLADILQWEPTVICSGEGTLGSSTGVASGLVLNTEYWCDEISSLTSRGIPNSGVSVAAPAAADGGKVTLIADCLGHQLIVLRISVSGKTAVTAGPAYRWLTGV